MNLEIDIPDLPFKKPVEVERILQLGFDQREGMDPVEARERIQEMAVSLADAYVNTKNADYEGCVAVIASALSETGAFLGGKFGQTMVAESELSAHQACRLDFPEE